MRLIFAPAAVKAMAKLRGPEGAALLAKLQAVAADPLQPFPWARRLTNQPGYRVRQGDWRALYRLDFEADEMIVDKVAHRGEVYR